VLAAAAAAVVVAATGEQRECWTGEGRRDCGQRRDWSRAHSTWSAGLQPSLPRGNIPLFFSYF